jgi:hypothetical protein
MSTKPTKLEVTVLVVMHLARLARDLNKLGLLVRPSLVCVGSVA